MVGCYREWTKDGEEISKSEICIRMKLLHSAHSLTQYTITSSHPHTLTSSHSPLIRFSVAELEEEESEDIAMETREPLDPLQQLVGELSGYMVSHHL